MPSQPYTARRAAAETPHAHHSPSRRPRTGGTSPRSRLARACRTPTQPRVGTAIGASAAGTASRARAASIAPGVRPVSAASPAPAANRSDAAAATASQTAANTAGRLTSPGGVRKTGHRPTAAAAAVARPHGPVPAGFQVHPGGHHAGGVARRAVT